MKPSRPSCVDALSTERNCATGTRSATEDATGTAAESRKPSSLHELRAQLRAQLSCNQSPESVPLPPARSCAVALPIERNRATFKVGDDDAARTPADDLMEREIAKLHSDPGVIYAMTAHADIDPDAVILSLVIRGKGFCELRIPKSRYDALALLELIKRHTTRETLQ
ncbi:MAG: hypothetical protein HZA63_15100 [Rhodocyclales bacterium]|nr:hypothetical protein [Rhodocyclales bacterium]